jgi:hypothetical protein
MIRKLALGLAAAITLGVAALAPSAASAGGFHHHHYRHGLFFAPAPIIVSTPVLGPGCFQKRLVQTRKGLRWRTVNACAF